MSDIGVVVIIVIITIAVLTALLAWSYFKDKDNES